MGVSEDVGGATLMAAATSSPELFINVVGTFVTEGDLGVGAVLGSAVFNILAVPAFCGICASKVHFQNKIQIAKCFTNQKRLSSNLNHTKKHTRTRIC